MFPLATIAESEINGDMNQTNNDITEMVLKEWYAISPEPISAQDAQDTPQDDPTTSIMFSVYQEDKGAIQKIVEDEVHTTDTNDQINLIIQYKAKYFITMLVIKVSWMI